MTTNCYIVFMADATRTPDSIRWEFWNTHQGGMIILEVEGQEITIPLSALVQTIPAHQRANALRQAAVYTPEFAWQQP